MTTLQGSILNLKTTLSLVKQYGDLQEFNGFKESTIEKNKDLFAIFFRKLQNNFKSLQNSEDLTKLIFDSRMSELNIFLGFGLVILIIVATCLLFPSRNLIFPSDICLDKEDGLYEAKVDILKKHKIVCKVTKSFKEKKIDDETNELTSQLKEARENFQKACDDYNNKIGYNQQGGGNGKTLSIINALDYIDAQTQINETLRNELKNNKDIIELKQIYNDFENQKDKAKSLSKIDKINNKYNKLSNSKLYINNKNICEIIKKHKDLDNNVLKNYYTFLQYCTVADETKNNDIRYFIGYYILNLILHFVNENTSH